MVYKMCSNINYQCTALFTQPQFVRLAYQGRVDTQNAGANAPKRHLIPIKEMYFARCLSQVIFDWQNDPKYIIKHMVHCLHACFIVIIEDVEFLQQSWHTQESKSLLAICTHQRWINHHSISQPTGQKKTLKLYFAAQYCVLVAQKPN